MKINSQLTGLSGDDLTNCQTLYNRKRGQKFKVVDGKLVKLPFNDHLKGKFSSSYRKKIHCEVSVITKNITTKLRVSKGKEGDKFVTDLFYNKLSPLSRKIYKRELSKDTYERLLSLTPVKTQKKSSKKFNESLKAATVWTKAGNTKSGRGCSGSYQVIAGKVDNVAEKSLGIFKPCDEETYSLLGKGFLPFMKTLLLRLICFFNRSSLPHIVGGQGFVAEEVSFLAAERVMKAIQEYLKQHPSPELENLLKEIVPETHVVSLKTASCKEERKGSFQLWCNEKHLSGTEYLGVHRNYRDKKKAKEHGEFPRELVDIMVIIDVITGNSDRHSDNLIFIVDENRKCKGLRLIDGGQAMAPQHPGKFAFLELQKLYHWRHHPIAKNNFTDLGKAIIDSIVKDKTSFCNEVKELYENHLPEDNKLIPGRIQCMSERIDVLKQYRNSTIRELSKIRTNKQIKTAVNVPFVEK